MNSFSLRLWTLSDQMCVSAEQFFFCSTDTSRGQPSEAVCLFVCFFICLHTKNSQLLAYAGRKRSILKTMIIFLHISMILLNCPQFFISSEISLARKRVSPLLRLATAPPCGLLVTPQRLNCWLSILLKNLQCFVFFHSGRSLYVVSHVLNLHNHRLSQPLLEWEGQIMVSISD